MSAEDNDVDREGCVSPCCRRFFIGFGEQRARELWAPIELVFVRELRPKHGRHQIEMGCTAVMPEGGCSVHADRPNICRIYECRTDLPMESPDEEPANSNPAR